MKILFLLLGASSLAFAQNTTNSVTTSEILVEKSAKENSVEVANNISSEPPHNKKALSSVKNSENEGVATEKKLSGNELIVSYESKKMKKARVYSSDGKLLQTSTRSLVDEKKLDPGDYLIKVDFRDGTSTSAKFTKQ